MTDPARYHWVAVHILPHEAEVRAWLRRHVHRLTSADIDDLIQEAYTRLCRAHLGEIQSGRSYLYASVRNLLMEQARRARIVPMERLGEIEALRIPSEEPGPDRRVGAHQELDRLDRIVRSLPEQCQMAFRLQKFEQLSQREIAARMNISEKTVEKHLAVALARVLQALQVEDGERLSPVSLGHNGHEAERRHD